MPWGAEKANNGGEKQIKIDPVLLHVRRGMKSALL